MFTEKRWRKKGWRKRSEAQLFTDESAEGRREVGGSVQGEEPEKDGMEVSRDGETAHVEYFGRAEKGA